jgi:diguanylate cyclase (GGDEF)-like protein
MTNTFQLLATGGLMDEVAASPWGPFEPHAVASLDELAVQLGTQRADALSIGLPDAAAAEALLHWPALSHAVLDAAMVVTLPDPSAALVQRLLDRGVQDVLPLAAVQAAPQTLARALRMAIQRKQIERAARKAYATDLATGLPNHAQLLEHMSHLLALREREPAPMALLVLRVEGLATTEARLGTESANVLRRKVAVRLRAGLRASDVVAAIGGDSFAVLLAWIDAPADGEHVAAKLVHALQQPFSVTGQNLALAVSAGISLYPTHGKDADALLHRAAGQAAGTASVGRGGMANFTERGPATAANDEEPPG